MTDWVGSVLRSSAEERARADMYAELRVHQLRIARIVGPQMWREIEKQVESAVRTHRANRHASDPEISFYSLLGGFRCQTVGCPRVDFVFAGKDPTFAVVEYNYGATYAVERSWTQNVEVKLDEKDNRYFLFDGKRFGDDAREIVRALLEPLTSRKFVPPEV